jgi:hypothetical protein
MLIGPIWKDGTLVTNIWIGDPQDPEAGSAEDISKAIRIILAAAFVTLLIGVISIYGIWG